jgi:cyclopropane fatty-acyl-phospholipid synthase-like methyltransferase
MDKSRSYEAIFNHRGSLYDRAMQGSPNARAREFEYLFTANRLSPNETVLDIPAGGGYLQAFVPDGVLVTGLEISEGFQGEPLVVSTFGDWQVGKFSRGVCLAASHHMEDKPRFLKKLSEHIESNGIIHLADVVSGSKESVFLDGFIGQFNETGHQGMYLHNNSNELAEQAGLQLMRDEIKDVAWRFHSLDEALRFATFLFGVTGCPQDYLMHMMTSLLGMHPQGEMWIVPWHLRYLDFKVA